jgi:hypothetical protein
MKYDFKRDCTEQYWDVIIRVRVDREVGGPTIMLKKEGFVTWRANVCARGRSRGEIIDSVLRELPPYYGEIISVTAQLSSKR